MLINVISLGPSYSDLCAWSWTYAQGIHWTHFSEHWPKPGWTPAANLFALISARIMEAIPPRLVVVQTHCWHVPNPGKLSARELVDIQCVILAIFQVLGVRRCYHGSCHVDIGELNTLRVYLQINFRREVIHRKKTSLARLSFASIWWLQEEMRLSLHRRLVPVYQLYGLLSLLLTA